MYLHAHSKRPLRLKWRCAPLMHGTLQGKRCARRLTDFGEELVAQDQENRTSTSGRARRKAATSSGRSEVRPRDGRRPTSQHLRRSNHLSGAEPKAKARRPALEIERPAFCKARRSNFGKFASTRSPSSQTV
mmetsp:Transcript_9009/g.23941  ORF Transcript_9009/g.23941 Transcript_9009/m.23941 type:complete len:132 (+) Transcript_9009:27-422(+)